jgi:hypothetical protein
VVEYLRVFSHVGFFMRPRAARCKQR